MKFHSLVLLVLGAPLALAQERAAVDHVLTQQDFVRFARGIEVSINEFRPEIMHEAFDVDAMMSRAYDGIEADPTLLGEFQSGVRAGFGFAAEVCNAVQLDGSYKLLSVFQKGDEVHARYRLLTAGGLNYHELTLEPSRGGGIRITDCYIYLAGEKMSESLRRSFLEIAATEDRSLIEKLLGDEAALVEHASDLVKINNMIRKGRLQHALRLYVKLPESLREQKSILLLGIQLTQFFDEERYIELLERYQELYPEDAGIDLLMIDYHMAKADYESVMTSLDRIEKLVVRDPYLDTLRGNVRSVEGRFDEAETYYSRSLTAEPTLVEGYWAFLDLALEKKDYLRVTNLLDGLIDRCQVELADLEYVDVFRDFTMSQEYKDWLASRNGEQG